MAKAKTLKDIKIKTTKPEANIICTKCGQEKDAQKDFYVSYNNKLSIAPFCKECVISNSLVEDRTSVDIEGFQNMLQQLDRPYLHQLFISNVKKYGENPMSVVGYYFKDISMPQYRLLKWSHSDFGHIEEKKEKEKTTNNTNRRTIHLSEDEREQLLDKWGDFEDRLLVRFEKKFQQLAQNYEIITSLHLEALTNYTKFSVLQDVAIENNNTQEAKMYGDLAKQARSDAKLNPSQLSKSDLNTGVSSFSEISQLVAQRDGLIRLPMKYLKKPHDQLDVLMWENINFNRALFSMPEVKYEEVYEYYIKRLEAFNKKYNADLDKGDLGTWLDD